MSEAPDRLSDEHAITEILADWRRRLRNAPDLQPREGVRGQRERSLTRALLAAADAPENSARATESRGKLAMIAALYFGRAVMLPVAAAVIVGVTLSPAIEVGRRYRIPAAVSAVVLVVAVCIGE